MYCRFEMLWPCPALSESFHSVTRTYFVPCTGEPHSHYKMKEVQDWVTSFSIMNMKLENILASFILDFISNCSASKGQERCNHSTSSNVNSTPTCLSILCAVLLLDLFTEIQLSFYLNDQSPSLDILQALSKGPIKTEQLKALYTLDLDLNAAQTQAIWDICVAANVWTCKSATRWI
jgi:hypothetical protein